MLWMFSTPSAHPPVQNNLFHQPQPAPSAPCPPVHHTGSSTVAHPQMVFSPTVLLPLCLFQSLFILKLSSVPAVLLASKQAFACLALPDLQSLNFQQKLPTALCALCAWCRIQRGEEEACLGPGQVFHVHIVGLGSRGDKTNHPSWPQLPG